MIPLDLPEPGAAEAEHSARLCAKIAEEIALAGGWVPFARYMELALYAPGLGYYSAGTHKLGRLGDYTTAPELSAVFACCMADAIGAVLGELGGGEILELGAGTGALAVELLTELARLGRLPGRYSILEVSADLRARQRAALERLPAGLRARVVFVDAPPARNFRGVVIGNEVLDALPVRRFRRTGTGVDELGVEYHAPGFRYAPRPAQAAVERAVAEIEAATGERLQPGYESEYAESGPALVATLAAPLEAGMILLTDYGLTRAEYYAPQRHGGTLACFYRHRVHGDPFVRVGLQDLTAWVDFTRVAEAGHDAGLEVAGYTTQAQFLLDTGFEAALSRVRDPLDARARHAATQAALTLVLPGEMGERFKCLALARGVEARRGFRLRDLSARL